MNNNAAELIIVGIIVAALAIGGSGYVAYEEVKSSNITPDTITDTSTAVEKKEITDDIITLITNIMGAETSEKTEDCFTRLDVTIYGIKGEQPDDIYQKYKDKCINDGYSIYDEYSWSGFTVTAEGFFAKSTLHGRFIIVVDPTGSNLLNFETFDTILITSSGFLNDYYYCQEMFNEEIGSI